MQTLDLGLGTAGAVVEHGLADTGVELPVKAFDVPNPLFQGARADDAVLLALLRR